MMVYRPVIRSRTSSPSDHESKGDPEDILHIKKKMFKKTQATNYYCDETLIVKLNIYRKVTFFNEPVVLPACIKRL